MIFRDSQVAVLWHSMALLYRFRTVTSYGEICREIQQDFVSRRQADGAHIRLVGILFARPASKLASFAEIVGDDFPKTSPGGFYPFARFTDLPSYRLLADTSLYGGRNRLHVTV